MDEIINNEETSQIVMNMFRERAKGITAMSETEWQDLDWSKADKEDEPKNYKSWKKDKEYISDWLKDVIKPSKSIKTYKQYKSAIRIFFRWNLQENDGIPIFKLKKRIFLKYKNWLLEDCMLSSNSIKLKKSALSSFFNFIEQFITEEDEKYENFRNPLRGLNLDIESNKVYDKKPITFKEFKEIQDYILYVLGNKLMYSVFTTMFYTGNRIGEIIQVKTSHCELEMPKGELFVETPDYIRGKGRGITGKLLNMRYTKEALKAINFWKDERDESLKDEEFLFVRRNKNDINKVVYLTDEDIRDFFKEEITPFLKRRISPHNIRASFATYLLEQGADLTVVKDLLNHENIEITSKFYDLRDKSQLINKGLKGIKL